jgi:hypothetical protein
VAHLYGNAFLINAEKGYLLTAKHVVNIQKGKGHVAYVIIGGKKFQAFTMWKDEIADTAVISIRGDGLSGLKEMRVAKRRPRRGDNVRILGYQEAGNRDEVKRCAPMGEKGFCYWEPRLRLIYVGRMPPKPNSPEYVRVENPCYIRAIHDGKCLISRFRSGPIEDLTLGLSGSPVVNTAGEVVGVHIAFAAPIAIDSREYELYHALPQDLPPQYLPKRNSRSNPGQP